MTIARHLFHGSRGLSGHGYAVCLRCGRAASEVGPRSETDIPEPVREGHTRLRGGRKSDGTDICSGAGFAIQRELSLGGSRTTDVFELQLEGLVDPGAALSLGIALRRAFCRRLGIEEQEIGVSVRPARAADESVLQSIFLFDAATGGNGYVAGLRDHVAPALREGVPILDCSKECDAACHGCLLTFDTQYDSAKLDRHKARAFLTDERLAGLALQAHHRILGEATRVVSRPLYRHFAEVAGEPGVEDLRIWLGGDADAWEAEAFPLYRDLVRRVDGERRARLFIDPETWSHLSEGNRHALAALVSAGANHIEVHLGAAPKAIAGAGRIVAAAGGKRAHVVWATTAESAPEMNEAWGQLPEDGVFVYAVVEESMPSIGSRPVSIEELRPEPEGTIAHLNIQTELNGRVEGFGSRFWTLVLDGCNALNDDFAKRGPLARVSYADRYVATPWALLLLREILVDLVREGRAGPGTALHLLTQDLRDDRRPRGSERFVTDPFEDDAARQAVFQHALETGRGGLCWEGSFEIVTGPAPHFRELRLDWADGTAWSLKLDQGVGYWRCRPAGRLGLFERAEEQLAKLNEITKRCRVTSQGIYPTIIYVAKADPARE